MIFEFDTCVLDTSKQELWRDGEPAHVEPQVLAVLEYLVTNSERVVTKIELLDEVWGDRFVSESALTSRIKLARKACGDNGRDQRILKTVHSRGYRFIAPVSISDVSQAAVEPSSPPAVSFPSSSDPSNPSAPPAVPSRQRPAMPPASSALVGRSAELALLDEAFAEVFHGHRRAVFVCGGIGAGKSTLIAEFLERQDDLDGWAIACGQCIQTRGGVEPYFCLLDALGQLARVEPASTAATLERVAPTWLAQMPSLVDHDALERLERRLLGTSPARMLREGVEALSALAEIRPLVLVLDDLHWADDCTLDVLDVLLQRTDPVPLLLVGAGRPDASNIGSVIEPAVAGGRVAVIELEPLNGEAVGALASDRLGGVDLPDDVIDIVARRSGGVPLFAEEIVAAWLRQDQIGVTDGVIEVNDTLDSLESTIPATLPPLIERELATLDPDELDVLEACAVVGDAFDAAAVAAALDRTRAATEDALASLSRRHGLIGATGASGWPDGTMSASYAFVQQLVREVLDDRIAPSHRTLLHGRVGRALEAGYGERAGEIAVSLAEHAIEAGDTLRAVEHLAVAGEQANARSAHTHAAGFLESALDRLGDLPPSGERDRTELLTRIALGPALVATRGWFDPSVSENYERALKLCRSDPNGAEAAAARYGLATVSELQGRFERTESLLTPLLAAEADGPLAIEAHELVACSTFHQGKFDRSLRNARMVLDSWDEHAYSVLMARIAEHPASSCSSWSSLALWALGRSDESLELAEHAVELGERNLYALSTAVQQRAMLHQLRGEVEPCLEWAERCRQVGEDQGFPMRTIQADIYKGWALGVSGRADKGLALIADGLARFREEGATLNEAYYLGMHADALLHAGEPQQALDELTTAAERTTSRTYFYEAELCRLTARSHLAAGGSDAIEVARRDLDDSRSITHRQGAVALELRTLTDRFELEAEQGKAQRWHDALAGLLAMFDGQRPTPDTVRAGEVLAG